MRLADFHTDQTLVLKAGAATYRIRLNRIIRKGADWIKARFEIESKRFDPARQLLRAAGTFPGRSAGPDGRHPSRGRPLR